MMGHWCWRNRYNVRAVTVLVGCVLLHISLGTLYTIGNMLTYMLSYMKANTTSAESITYKDGVLISSLMAVGQGLCMSVGGLLEPKIGPRLTILLGSFIMSAGVTLTMFTIQKSFYAVLVTYGIMNGMGIGIAYVTPITAAMRWFPKHKGLVSGIVVAGFGGGAFIFNQVQTALLNPNNLPANKTYGENGEKYFSQADILDRVPHVFLILGGCYFAIQVVATMLITFPPNSSVMSIVRREIDEGESETSAIISANLGCKRDIGSDSLEGSSRFSKSPKEILKSVVFYQLCLIFACNLTAVGYISPMYKAFGQEFIQDDRFLALVGAFASVFNCSGRVVWGSLGDRFSFKTVMAILSALSAVLFLSFYASFIAGKVMYTIWVFAIFFVFSGNFALLPAASTRAFGPKNASVNYGLIGVGMVSASIFSLLLTLFLQNILGWFGMFCVCAGLSCIAFVVVAMFSAKTYDGQNV